jgi:hypothetical protein
MEFSSPSKRQY